MLRARRAISLTDETRYTPQLELLEPRLAMTASLYTGDALPPVLSHGGGCTCPICTGQGLQNLVPAQFATTTGSGGLVASSPLSALPQLSSNSSARVKLFLDFNGDHQASWGSYTNVNTKVFDQDGDFTTFSTNEIASIHEIWARVSEDYAPFNIDVTTIDPGSLANGLVAKIDIGGNYTDWFGQAAGGVAYVGGFTNSAPNVGFAFSDALGHGTARYVAEAASHEAGHLFGLLHQSTWVNGQLQDEYNSGNSGWAPIMGVGYYSTRTTWHNGTNDVGPNSYQDDVSIIAGAANGFGLRADDYSNSFTTPSNLFASGGSVNFAGLINSRTDVDVFGFSTSGGAVNFQMNVAQYGPNLDGALELRSSSGSIITTADPSDSFGASISTSVAAGSYFLVVRGSGAFGNSSYGNMGQYTITGSVPAATPAPEVSVLVGTTDIADGGTIDFGSTQAGTPVDRTITVKNVGTADLSVSAITSSMPAGFTLVSNLNTTTLHAGDSVSFVVRFASSSTGSFGGNISFTNNDADEGTYDLHLQGTVAASSTGGGGGGSVTRIIDDGAVGNSLTGSWRVGSRGREGDVHVASRSSSAAATATSRWTFNDLAAGQYRVYMSWTGDRGNASNAPVKFYGGTQLLGNNFVNQRSASSGYQADGTNWSLVRVVTISGNNLSVLLTNVANGSVVADAVRIERITTSAAAHGAVVGGDSGGSSAARVLVASASRSEQVGSQEHGSELQSSSTGGDRHDEVFRQELDIAPELGLLENTLDLVRELSHYVGSLEDSGAQTELHTESLFGQESDWLAVL